MNQGEKKMTLKKLQFYAIILGVVFIFNLNAGLCKPNHSVPLESGAGGEVCIDVIPNSPPSLGLSMTINEKNKSYSGFANEISYGGSVTLRDSEMDAKVKISVEKNTTEPSESSLNLELSKGF